MKIKKYTLKFINGKGKTYLRYYCTIDGKGSTYDKPCDCFLSPEDLKKINDNSLGGLVQKSLNKVKEGLVQVIERFNVKNNTYPTPEYLKIYDNAIYSTFNIEYQINQYYKNIDVKDSSKKTYGFALARFKQYFILNLSKYSVNEMITEKVITDFGKWLVEMRKVDPKIKAKDISKISVYNSQVIVFKFLNHIAKNYSIQRISDFLQRPQEGKKYHLTKEDVQRILEYPAKTEAQQEVLDIIKINQYVGLRIGEIMKIDKRNVEVNGVCKILFIEPKKTRKRTVVIVNQEAVDIITKHMNLNFNSNSNLLFHFNDRGGFNLLLTKICKEVFKDEKVLIYKNTYGITDDVEYLKYKVISSHAFRRYAIERNVNKYGIETARTLSGHSDYRTIIKHYSDFLNAEDLTEKLLQKS